MSVAPEHEIRSVPFGRPRSTARPRTAAHPPPRRAGQCLAGPVTLFLLAALLSCSDGASPQEIVVRPLDPTGAPLAGSVAWTERAEAREFYRARAETELTLPGQGAPYVVVAPGHRPVRVEAAAGEMEIRLERGLPIRLTVAYGAKLPEPPFYVAVRVLQVDGPLPEDKADWLDACPAESFPERKKAGDPVVVRQDRREVALLVHGPGSYEVRWSVLRITWDERGGKVHPNTVTGPPPEARHRIEVKESEEEQQFAFPVDPSLVRRTHR